VRFGGTRAGVPIVDTGFRYPLNLDRKEMKERIEEVNASSGADIACFGKTLDILESDLSMMRLRANAWAVGDVPRACPPCTPRNASPANTATAMNGSGLSDIISLTFSF